MSQVKDGVDRLVARTEAEINALYARYVRGDIERDEFVTLAATVLTRARMQGVALADLALTAEVIRTLRTSAAPLGIAPPDDDFERLTSSVSSVLDQDIRTARTDDELRESRRLRLLRLGRDSAAEATVWAFGLGMVMRGIGGWVRETGAKPCPVCTNLADGVVRPSSMAMLRPHLGCACVQQPILT